ncbi:FAD-dependent oxidoreductase [Edaphobacter sp. 4G125]|nr:FAD-dependent oxidoreductase [Edaphobacter sp. 4G125]QNI36170.1 FAD-dependent oxidoreductase [Edaphobacter sp. 4G125]
MDRRHFLRTANLAAISAAVSGCARKTSTVFNPALNQAALAPVNLPESACHIPPVRVAEDRVIRTVVGLRPYRPSGFRVEREQVGDTVVVHNYGHGGGGITLSWGTAKLATDLGLKGHTGPVAVLGCGVVGLTTARMVQDAGFSVTIYTKAMPPDTTSNIAGGQWYPATVYEDSDKVSASFTDQFLTAAKYAYERYQITTDPRYGVRWMRNYSISRTPIADRRTEGRPRIVSGLDSLLPERRLLRQEENPFRIGYASQYDGMIMEPPMLLNALITDFRIAGGKVLGRELKSPAEVQTLPEKLVFNCTGLGAKALFDDQELTPIRGQLTFLLPQPEVTYAAMFEDAYMFSRHDGILLGGTHEEGNWSLEVDQATVKAKLAKHAELFNSMKAC